MPMTKLEPGKKRTIVDPTAGLPEQPGLGELVGAAFQVENVAVNALQRFRESPDFGEGDPNFDPRDHLRPEERVHQDHFARAESAAEMAAIRKALKREREARATLDSANPVTAFALSALAGTLDVTSLLPLGSVARGATIGGRIARGAFAGAGGNAVAESALQGLQRERTVAESVAAITIGGVIGGGLGAGAHMVMGRDTPPPGDIRDPATASAIQEHATLLEQNAGMDGRSIAGAASVRPAPISTELVSTGGVAESIAKLRRMGLSTPGITLSASPIPASREIGQGLVDSGLFSKGDFYGGRGATSVETRIKSLVNSSIDEVNTRLREGVLDYRKRSGDRRMTDARFREEVGRALRRGDQSAIPEVARAANEIRVRYLDPLKKQLIDAGLLPKDVDTRTAASYFTRVYDLATIRARRAEFHARIADYLKRVASDEFEGADDIEDAADGIIDAILGVETGALPTNIPLGKTGALRERTFNIPDVEIEDFLIDDAGFVLERYFRGVIPDLEFKNRFGEIDPSERFGRLIREDARRLGLSADQANADADDIAKLVRVLKGRSPAAQDPQYDGLRRIGSAARTFNFTTDLGSVLISSVSDVAMPMLQEGVGRAFRGALAQLSSGRVRKLSKREANLAGTMLESSLATRRKAMFDLQAHTQQMTRAERGINRIGNEFARLTFLDRWTDAMKGWASQIVSTRIVQTSRKVASGGLDALTRSERMRLGRAGIDEAMARRIAAQAQGEGVDEIPGGLGAIANTAAWTDAGAVRAFRDALFSDVEKTIITPGAGDAPLWMSGELAKMATQYKRFGIAAVQKASLAGLQRRDQETLSGVVALLAMGGLGAALRDIARDGKVEERSPNQWAVEMVDRSGLIMPLVELDTMLNRAAHTPSIVQALAGEEPSRFAGRNKLDIFLGPTAGTIEDAGLLSGASFARVLEGEEFTTSDLHRARRLLPGQNLFWLRGVLSKIEEGAGEALDLEDTRPD